MDTKLCIPEKILQQHVVVLGKTGAGKSSKLRHIVEHLLARKKRVCIIDPKGDWWGLKKSADGRGPGFKDVIAFGDFKEQKASDVPINAQSGKPIADLITSGNRPCIIGFRGWMPGALVKFWLDFAPALFNAQSGELYLVIDEVHNFAPKGKILDPDAGRCIHWTNRLMSEGRGLGLVCCIASQRPQKVHNDTLTCCETLIAARVIHKADRMAVKDWIDGCGDSDKGDEVLDGLAQLERPQAWVWSPESGFGPEKVSFPMFGTFDSFAPPQLQKRVSDEGWGTVNLEDVTAKLAAVIEERKANDPVQLKEEIRRLNAELKRARQEPPKGGTPNLKPVEVVKEVPVLTEEDRKLLARACQTGEFLIEKQAAGFDQVRKFNEDLSLLRTQIDQRLSKFSALPQGGKVQGSGARFQVRPAAKGISAAAARAGNGHTNYDRAGDGALPSGERKIIEACIQFPDGVSRQQLTVLTTFKRSTRDKYIQILREKGLVDVRGDTVFATHQGMEAVPDAQPLPTGEALQQHWLGKLPEGEARIFRILLDNYPNAVSRDFISEQTGYKRSTRDKYLQLMSAKLIFTEPARGEVMASKTLFE